MKKTVTIVLVMLLGLAIWYVCIKKYDYQISFKANAAPGSVYDQVKNVKSGSDDIKDFSIEETDLFKSIRQEVIIDSTAVILDWYFESISDTITKIKVGIISKEHSLQHRLQIITGSSPLVNLVKNDMIDFRKKLRYYTDSFRVIIDGEIETPEMNVLLVSSKTKRSRKANEMMRSNAYLHPKLAEHNISKNGFPFVKIKHWDTKTDSIHLDFGFPIIYNDSLPVSSHIIYNKMESKKALKATYYGNYRNSDEAWFALLEYADKHHIALEKTPLEIFYNNPMMGGTELQWKAEIFFPIKN